MSGFLQSCSTVQEKKTEILQSGMAKESRGSKPQVHYYGKSQFPLQYDI